jgi:dienelactone hydrolase
MRALHAVQQTVDAALQKERVVHDGARLWQHVVPQPLWPEGEAAQPATRMPGKGMMSVRHSETNPVPPEVRVLDHGLRVHHYRPIGKVCRGIVVLAPGGRGGMGPGELSPSGGQASPRAGSSTTMSAGLFSPSIVSVFSRLGVSLTKEGIAVCHLTWRSPPIRLGASRELLHTVKTLREAQLEIEAAVRFMRTVHELDSLSPALPLVLVGFCFGGAAALAAAATSLRATLPFRGPPTLPVNKGLGPLAGVLGMGLALRIDDGSPTRSYADLDTFNCVPVLARAAVPLLLLHGTSDELIGATAANLLFDAIEGPKAAGWLVGAEHDLISRHEAAHQTAHAWILGLLHRSRVCGGMLMQMQPPKESEEGIPFGRAVTF